VDGARYLEDGKLTVFRRAGIYYARLRSAGSSKYIARSLRTSNEQAAVDLGRRLLFQLEQRPKQAYRRHGRNAHITLSSMASTVACVRSDAARNASGVGKNDFEVT
jgi:hypothetical protein